MNTKYFKIFLKIKQHFISYPLMSYRLVKFKLWSDVLDLAEKKAHLTKEGLDQIFSIKAALPYPYPPLP